MPIPEPSKTMCDLHPFLPGVTPLHRPRLLISTAACLTVGLILLGTHTARAEDYPLTLNDITVRDPFIHADESTNTYYLYAQTGNRKGSPDDGVEAYRSKDLVHWSQPKLVFRRPDDFWGGKEIWAPEMHKIGGK